MLDQGTIFNSARRKGTLGFVSILMGMIPEEEVDGTEETVINYRSKVLECLKQGDNYLRLEIQGRFL